jgi:hypothetical protein
MKTREEQKVKNGNEDRGEKGNIEGRLAFGISSFRLDRVSHRFVAKCKMTIEYPTPSRQSKTTN